MEFYTEEPKILGSNIQNFVARATKASEHTYIKGKVIPLHARCGPEGG